MVIGFIGKDTGGTDLHQITAKGAIEGTALKPAKVDITAYGKDIEIASLGHIAIKPHTAIAGNTAIHLMFDKRAQLLIVKGALRKTVATIVVATHDRHILKMALAPLVAHRAVMGMIDHQPLYYLLPKGVAVFMVDEEAIAILDFTHAGHSYVSMGIPFIR